MRSPVSFVIVIIFLANLLCSHLVVATEIVLPTPGAMVKLSPAFNAPILKAIKVDQNNPFKFEFVLNVGNGLTLPVGRQELFPTDLKDESKKLIK